MIVVCVPAATKRVAPVTQTVITPVLRRSACQVWYPGGETDGEALPEGALVETPTMTGCCARSHLRSSTRTPAS